MAAALQTPNTYRSLHRLGVVCGLAAGAWLGAAEAPVKFVTLGLSPVLISFVFVAGVFVARWTLPALLAGTGQVMLDLRSRPHLIVWAVLAGALWAVANTLTVFAIRDVGLAIAFPIWNINSLVGVFWGWLFFRELRAASRREWMQVVVAAVAIAGGAVILAGAARTASAAGVAAHAGAGIAAALGAGLLWGTMYVPYRKAYLSGMNPLSFVTIFTLGEGVTMTALALGFLGGASGLAAALARARPALFWLFLGGFCWVVGDLFQQYAAKYIGIGRGIPLSNTNQLWGLAWGALVFGELRGLSGAARAWVIAGSATMIMGALLMAGASASEAEQACWRQAVERECRRYGLRREEALRAQRGEFAAAEPAAPRRRAGDGLIVLAALGCFAGLALIARRQPLAVHTGWMAALLAAMLALLLAGGSLLWRRTRFH